MARKKAESIPEILNNRPPYHALTRASSSVEKGIANSAAPGTTSSLASEPNARTSLAVQCEEMKRLKSRK